MVTLVVRLELADSWGMYLLDFAASHDDEDDVVDVSSSIVDDAEADAKREIKCTVWSS